MAAAQETGIDVRGRVLSYRRSALMEDFAGGGHRSHDATTLEIHAPERVKGSRMVIYHDTPPDPQSIWREVGAMLEFHLDADLLAEGVQVFSGAAGKLRRVDIPTGSGD